MNSIKYVQTLQEYSRFLQILVHLELSGSTKRDKYIAISGIKNFFFFFYFGHEEFKRNPN